METNPRVRVPGEWAPPPPVIIPEGDSQPSQAPPPVPGPDQAEEFEDILGSLVEHYSTLPPASFGEPPEAVFESAADQTVDTTRRRSPVLWIVLGVVGLSLAGLGAGGFYAYNRLKLSLDPSQIAAQTAPAVNIVVKNSAEPGAATTLAETPAPVEAAPKVEQLTPAVQPLEPEQSEEVEEATAPEAEPAPQKARSRKARSRATKPRRAKVVKKKVRRARRTRRVVSRKAERKPARASASEDWADPYK